jgi:hypothetical protein
MGWLRFSFRDGKREGWEWCWFLGRHWIPPLVVLGASGDQPGELGFKLSPLLGRQPILGRV